ncbi:MAG: alkaline phosphatase D family protein [Candidatus Neomarinimicrobiota bacterium]
MANLTIGPVIGEVTDTTARILIEVDQAAEVSCRLQGNNGELHNSNQDFNAGRPGTFQFEGLDQSTLYKVTLTGVDNPYPGSFRTFPTEPNEIQIGIVSCNDPIRETKDFLGVRRFFPTRRLKHLDKRHVRKAGPKHIDLLVHMGDQIYGDRVFKDYRHQLQNDNNQRNNEAFLMEIESDYRAIYRKNWYKHRWMRHILANVPNLMIWDDHDIADDWGISDSDRDPDSKRRVIGNIARRIYREYQRQLWTADVSIPASPTPDASMEYHHHRWGNFGMIFLDTRGSRSFNNQFAKPKNYFLGTQQWEWLNGLLKPGGEFEDVTLIGLVSPVPLVYFPDVIPDKIFYSRRAQMTLDTGDHWSLGKHRPELNRLIELMDSWKQAKPETREIIVLSGDVHMGGFSEILKDGERLFTQFISSALSKDTGQKYTAHFIRLFNKKYRINAPYTFRHRIATLVPHRNYGIVRTAFPSQARPSYHLYLEVEKYGIKWVIRYKPRV